MEGYFYHTPKAKCQYSQAVGSFLLGLSEARLLPSCDFVLLQALQSSVFSQGEE